MRPCSVRNKILFPFLLLLFAPCPMLLAQSQAEYRVEMEFSKHTITAICVVEGQETKEDEQDTIILMTMVNEFGVKYFDVVYSGGKAKLLNAIKPLRRWYIRQTLQKDFSHILPSLINHLELKYSKGKRHYTFTPINQKP